MPSPNVPNIERDRAAFTPAIGLDPLAKDRLPASFPMARWNEQAKRYLEYWKWFNGESLNAVAATTQSGEDVLEYPLQMNAVRNFSRKLASLLIGHGPDEPYPPIQTSVHPLRPWSGEEPSDEDKKLAGIMEHVANTVWTFSGGRALQMEAATLSQFLGGYVFKVTYLHGKDKQRENLPLPILIEGFSPDFFLPVWGPREPWWLHEAFVVYRVPAISVEKEYGIDTGTHADAVYCEHWTRDHYSVFINGKLMPYAGKENFFPRKNPWGFVPFVYIPTRREGNFYGPSIIPDIKGLVQEFNARMADQGDAIADTVHRERYMRDVTNDPESKQLGDDKTAIDLGQTNPSTKAQPDVWVEDPPQITPALTEFARNTLWLQLQREGSLGPVAFGEDEGSQRSGLTLAIRFWPSTSVAHVQRTFWSDAKRIIDTMILLIVSNKNMLKEDKIVIPEDFRRRFVISQRWQHMIPRDREQEINETVLLVQSGLRSRETGIREVGGVRSVKDELASIREDMEFSASLAPSGAASGAEKGAAEDIVTPTASTGLSEQE